MWCKGAGCRVVARLVNEIAAASVLNVIPRRLVNIRLNVDVYCCVNVCVCVCLRNTGYSCRVSINSLKCR